MIIKENLPRSKWKIGKILELIKGKDQAIQSAKVLISPNKVLHRALNLLYPIECPEDQTRVMQDHAEAQEEASVTGKPELEYDSDSEDSRGELQADKILSPTIRRPVRQATLAAKQKLKKWLNPTEDFAALGSVAISIAMMS